MDMASKRRGADKSDFELELDGGGRMVRRRTRLLPDGSYLFEDELDVKGVLTAKVITCAAWLVELYELKAGELFFLRGETEVRPATNCFGVLYPPFTMSQFCFKHTRGRLAGFAATTSLPKELTGVPLIFETTSTRLPASVSEVIKILHAGRQLQAIEINPKPSLISLKAKRLIDENYLSYPSIARIAQRLRVTHEHLSRQFKRDFGMSPSKYFNQLRMADAPLRLARGEEIIDVSHAVGYNDLSRFYKQFRRTTKTSPGACRAIMKPRRAPSGRREN